MKKFIRLIFGVTILLGVFLSFNYVNECNHIKSVFNDFLPINDPEGSKNCYIINETYHSNYVQRNFFDTPLPTWERVGDLNVYSAFWDQGDDENYIAFGFGINYRDFDLKKYSCHVWFEVKNIVVSVTGSFKVEGRPFSSSSLNSNKYICKIKTEEMKGRPSVLVIIQSDPVPELISKSFIPIFFKDKQVPYKNKTAVCVLPDRVGTGMNNIVEFISFHQLIGVTDFIIYGNSIHYNILSKIKEWVQSTSFVRTITLLPWNFPFNNKKIERELIIEDCQLRTYQHAQAFTILDWDQFIIPKDAKPIFSSLPSNLDNTVYKFQSQLCCTDEKNDKRSENSWPVILQKTHCLDYNFDQLFITQERRLSKETRELDYSAYFSIKTFRSCTSLKGKGIKYDHSPFKFLSGLLSNSLLRLWNSGSMF